MAEFSAVAHQALKKLEDHLTCPICFEAFKDPKMLQCFHVYCKDCLQRLVVQDQQGQLSLRCPTCRQSTVLPQATGVSGLQSAFHVHHLLEIKDALEKVKEPQMVIPYSSKFSWHNIFVNFVISLLITKIFLTKIQHQCGRGYVVCARAFNTRTYVHDRERKVLNRC